MEVLKLDYRRLTGHYDRIVSIEMLEAIGHDQLPTYFRAIDRLLGPHGVAAIQTITIPEQRYRSYRRSEDWLRRHIFPGGLLPSVGEIARVCARATQLGVYRLDEIGPHYAPTLGRWRERFLERVAEVRALGFDERFCRTWEFYLAYCEAAFASRAIRDVQLGARAAVRARGTDRRVVRDRSPSPGARRRHGGPTGWAAVDRDAIGLDDGPGLRGDIGDRGELDAILVQRLAAAGTGWLGQLDVDRGCGALVGSRRGAVAEVPLAGLAPRSLGLGLRRPLEKGAA